MKKGLTMLVVAIIIIGLIAAIGSVTAANYVWVDSNVKGVGYKNAEYEVDTEYGIANGIEMSELEAGSGLVTKETWTLEVNPMQDLLQIGEVCVEGLIEKKELDAEYFPITYQNHSYDLKWLEKKCVKNYDLGAVTDANFVQCEKLQKKESVETYGDGIGILTVDAMRIGPVSLYAGLPAAITQTVTADVVGISHIGFAAKDPDERHHTIAYGKEETIGQFHIEKTIDIRLDCTRDMTGDWLGCP